MGGPGLLASVRRYSWLAQNIPEVPITMTYLSTGEDDIVRRYILD